MKDITLSPSSMRIVPVLALAAIGVMAIVVGGILVATEARARAGLRDLDRAGNAVTFVNELDINATELGLTVLTYVSPGGQDTFEAAIADSQRDNSHWLDELERVSQTDEERDRHRRLSEGIARYEAIGAQLVAQRRHRDSVLTQALGDLASGGRISDRSRSGELSGLIKDLEEWLTLYLAEPSEASSAQLLERDARLERFLLAGAEGGPGGAVARQRLPAAFGAVAGVREFVEADRALMGLTTQFLAQGVQLGDVLDESVRGAAFQAVTAADARVRSNQVVTNVSLGLGLGALAIVSLGALYVVRRRMLERVSLLTTATEAVRSDDLSYRIDWPYADELAPLAGSLNHMMERIESTTVSKAEVEAREAEYRALVQALPDEVLRITGDDPPVRVSVPYAGGSREDHPSVLPSGYESDLRTAVAEAHASGDIVSVELSHPPAPGEHGGGIAFEVRVRAIDERSAIAVVHNVTKAREMAASLTDAAAEWRQTFDAIEDGIVSLKGIGAATVIRRVNRSALALLGGTFEHWIGRPVETIGARQPWTRALEAIAHLDEGASTLQHAGDDTGQEWHVWCARKDGPTGEGVIVVRNVTELLRLQSSLERSRTMAAMGALLASVAHEVRNPLFAITSTVQALAARGAEADFSRYQAVLAKEADRMRHLMTDLLEFGRPFNSHHIVVTVDQVVMDAAASCAALAASRHVTVIVEVPPVYVRTDEQRLRRVFVNLLENAIQHSSEGGRVVVDGRPSGTHAKSTVEIRVRDSGPGFSEPALQSACTPFFSERQGGTGLGLAIVSQIVDEHHGELRLSNAREGGGVVEVLLPEATLDEETAAVPA